MSTVRSRLVDITSLTITTLLVMSLMTTTTTLMWNAVQKPKYHDLSISGSRVMQVYYPIYLPSPSYDPNTPYYIDDELEDNIHPPTEAQLLKLNQSLLKTSRKFQQLIASGDLRLMHRILDQIALYVSGEVDFSGCWGWNTKMIYVTFLAQYTTRRGMQTEAVFLDAIIRDVRPPSLFPRLFRRVLEYVAPKGKHDWQETEKEHDAEGVYIDHVHKKIRFDNATKYYVEDFHTNTLKNEEVKIVIRYQVVGHFGWEPMRELNEKITLRLGNHS
ncbi:unnamed protein product [Phytomonas sp. EM1]|nr:unnamed protein product [Phytomonas sp. EM1]|eukprot:CCW65773.1 unnamed protein product [Phytomonas sp. isolate EM1]